MGNHYSAINQLLFFSSFQSYSLIAYLSMIIPLIFLSCKLFTISNFLSSKARKEWRLLFDERLYKTLQLQLARIEPQRANSLSQIKIKANRRKSDQHAFTVNAKVIDEPIVESPELEE